MDPKSRPPEGAEKGPQSGPFGPADLGPRRGLKGPQEAPGGTIAAQGHRRCLDGTEGLLGRFKSPARVPAVGHAGIAAAGCPGGVPARAAGLCNAPSGLTGGADAPQTPNRQVKLWGNNNRLIGFRGLLEDNIL